MYHYLTGAASWYMMTVITQAFGVRGERGDLVISPKLVREQFNERGTAAITLPFAGKELHVTFANIAGKDYGQYKVEKAYLTVPEHTQMRRLSVKDGKAVLEREAILRLPDRGTKIVIELM